MTLPLTHGQEALWYLDRLDPVGGVHTIAAAARVLTPFDPAAFVAAAHDLAAHHPALRATVVETPDGPRQRIGDEPRIESAVVDLRSPPLERSRPASPRTPIAPSTSPGAAARLIVYRRRGSTGEDGGVGLPPRPPPPDRRPRLLRADRPGPGDLLPPSGRGRLRGRAAAGADAVRPVGGGRAPADRWPRGGAARRLVGRGGARRAAAPGAAHRPRPPGLPGAPGAHRLHPPGHRDREAPAPLRPGRRASLSTLLLAAFQAVLHRLSGQAELAVGVPTAGRKSRERAGVVGYLVNPVVVTSRLAGQDASEPTFGELLESTRERLVAAVDHRDHPFPLLARRVRPERDPARPPVFQAMFVHQRVRGGGLGAFHLAHPGTRLDLGGALVRPLRLPDARAQMDIQLSSAEIRGRAANPGLALELQVAADLFDRTTARRWLESLRVLLEAAVEDPETPVAELPLLTPGERAAVVSEWPGSPSVPGGEPPPIHRAFLERAEAVPERIALVGGSERWSYGALARRVRRGAARLRAPRKGAGPEARVAVGLARSPELVATLLAVLESGAAYVPVDPALPETRRRLLLRDSGARWFVGDADPPAGSGDLARVTPTELFAPGEVGTMAPEVHPESLAYLIYTSGSTGTPKAVGIRHRERRRADRLGGPGLRRGRPGRRAGRHLGGLRPLGLRDLHPAVRRRHGGAGRRSRLRPPGSSRTRERVTLLNTVPSALAEVLRLRPLPPSLRALNLAGEPLPEALAEEVYRQLREGGRLINLYAPSESTTYSTSPGCPRRRRRQATPAIGRPLDGERAHVVGPDLAPLPLGVPGELVLGGVGIARGYLGRPRLTAERFVPDPFAGEAEPGARIYRTGDVAWWRSDGELRFGGRRDHQVKIRGFRIELGEIEAALGAHPEVAQAVVAATERKDALRAFVLPAAESLAADELGRWLAERLPAPLVPRSFAVVTAFPRTSSGKIDRRALLAEVPEPGVPSGPKERAESGRVAPGTATEQALARLFREVLELPDDAPLGIHDDLFRLGGHSLLAARLASRVREDLGAEVMLREVIAAAHHRRAGGGGGGAPGHRRGDPPGRRSGRAAPLLRPGAALVPRPPRPGLGPLQHAGGTAPAGRPRRSGPGHRPGAADRPPRPAALPLRRHRGEREGAGAPALWIEPPGGSAGLPVVDLSALDRLGGDRSEEEAERVARAEARRPVPLLGGPPLRRLLIRRAPDDHLLLLVLHHAVADGWSFRVVLPRELAALYRGQASAPP